MRIDIAAATEAAEEATTSTKNDEQGASSKQPQRSATKSTKKRTQKRKPSAEKSTGKATSRTPKAAEHTVLERRTTITGLSSTLDRALRHATLDDRIDMIVRVRAMVELWQNSSTVRTNLGKHPARSHRDALRLEFKMTPEMHRDLAVARIDDGMSAVARIRALIDMWHTDSAFRQRTDRLAKQRNDELHRGRLRKEAAARSK